MHSPPQPYSCRHSGLPGPGLASHHLGASPPPCSRSRSQRSSPSTHAPQVRRILTELHLTQAQLHTPSPLFSTPISILQSTEPDTLIWLLYDTCPSAIPFWTPGSGTPAQVIFFASHISNILYIHTILQNQVPHQYHLCGSRNLHSHFPHLPLLTTHRAHHLHLCLNSIHIHMYVIYILSKFDTNVPQPQELIQDSVPRCRHRAPGTLHQAPRQLTCAHLLHAS